METFAVQFPEAMCSLAYRCCTPEHVTRLFPYGSPSRDVNDCRSHHQRQLSRYIEVLQMRLAPVRYDGQRATRCLARLAAMTCADLVQARIEALVPALECKDVFTVQGNQPEGARCGQPYDCAEGLSCKQPAHDHPGVCGQPPPGECPPSCPGGFCDSGTAGACVAGAPDGAACRSDVRCATRVCWGADPRLQQDGACGLPAGVCALQQ